jgi:putative transposase
LGLGKKVVTLPARREVAIEIRARFDVSERRSIDLALLHRSTARYRTKRQEDPVMTGRLLELAAQRPRHGYDLLWRQLRREGFVVNRKRLLRLYRREKLSLRTKPRKKLVAAVKRVREAPATRPAQRWSMDFMHDSLSSGRSYRVLNVLDEFSRECLAAEVDLSLPAERVVRVLDRLVEQHGRPDEIWVDNGPEFTSRILDRWAARSGVEIRFIRPGKPIENCFIESFNGTVRRDCLEAHWFDSLAEARLRIEAWRRHYNHDRPHTSLGGLAPAEFAALRSPSAPSEPQTPRRFTN